MCFCLFLGLAAPHASADSDIQFDKVNERSIDRYVVPNIQNLSRTYWATGMFDMNDDEAIDWFLRINDCDLYRRYRHNDFEWMTIREATKQHIQQNMSKFPTHFEIMSEITLGDYDVEEEMFDIMPDSKLQGLRKIEFTANEESSTIWGCGDDGLVDIYPANIIVVMNRPLTLERIPVKAELAQLYLEEIKERYSHLDSSWQMHVYKRLAYVRIKVKVTQYKNLAHTARGYARAVMLARYDGLEVFADPDRMMPLYFQEVQKSRFRRVKPKKKEESFEDQLIAE